MTPSRRRPWPAMWTIAGVFSRCMSKLDNEARKPGKGVCFTGSTPDLYGAWLLEACTFAARNFEADERLVFINAWNEWAEGAYLEPDRRFGFAYLVKTAQVLNAVAGPSSNAETGLIGVKAGLTLDTPSRLSIKRRARRFARRTLNRCATLAEDLAWKLRGH